MLPINNLANLTVMNALHQELESLQLPPIEIMTFDGNPSQWPEFTAEFKERVHLKQTFSDQRRMERLLNVLTDDAKRLVESTGKSNIFYAAALKSLKRYFGNSFYVSHIKLSELFDKPQIKVNDHIALRGFHQKVKCINTSLKPMGYLKTFSPAEYIVKAVKRPPNHLRNLLYNSHSNITLKRNSFISLEQFEKWLDSNVKEQFNPIANILSIDQRYRPRDHIRSNNINQDESQEIKCWFCSDDHILGSCDQFLSKPL